MPRQLATIVLHLFLARRNILLGFYVKIVSTAFCIAFFLLFFHCMPHNHGNKGDLLPVVWVEQQRNKKKMCFFLLLINIDINWVDLEWRYERWMWFYCLRLNRIFFSTLVMSPGQEKRKNKTLYMKNPNEGTKQLFMRPKKMRNGINEITSEEKKTHNNNFDKVTQTYYLNE